MKAICQRCGSPAARGAFTWGMGPPLPWLFALLCEACGTRALELGARRIRWRPKPSARYERVRGMGSVEIELRRPQPEILTGAAHRVWQGARAELARRGVRRPTSSEIASEAIEAAGALGL